LAEAFSIVRPEKSGASGKGNVRASRTSEVGQGIRVRRDDPQGPRAPGARREIVGLSSGEPDFRSPAHAIEAAHQAALAGETKYPPQDGVLPLKKAVQKKFKRDNNLDYALDEIMVSNGSKQIMYNATMASVNPGDEVIIPSPGWISYADQVKLAGACRSPCRARRTTTSTCAPPTSMRRSRPRPSGWC